MKKRKKMQKKIEQVSEKLQENEGKMNKFRFQTITM
jgi:hypothetical protein